MLMAGKGKAVIKRIGRGKGVKTGNGMKLGGYGHWSTMNEIQFLDGLGTYSSCKASRMELLRGYLSAAFKRENWGRIDKDVIIARVMNEVGDDDKEVCHYCGATKNDK